ncbi:chymotrypsin inhibitor Ani s 6-like [Rhipicephalus sanguineus]|uniref:chymotrypsin inhibitor Ani s 6-like n=1 Tax=Rhipicephalus sanguineus TaxID=34632 RepID=UPI0018940F2B|nr:chymotrypsin inhibitor Ani s 6-like [Rhipicephalus sanguineus]
MPKLFIVVVVLVTVVAVLSAPSCPKDEEYRTVGACDPVNCPETKPTPPTPGKEKPPKLCTLQAFTGCFCRAGLYRRKSDKKCVPMDQCWSK